MTVPQEYTAADLAEALGRYGDLPIALALVSGDDESPRAVEVRLELGVDGVGARQLIITGYLDSDAAPTTFRARFVPWREPDA